MLARGAQAEAKDIVRGAAALRRAALRRAACGVAVPAAAGVAHASGALAPLRRADEASALALLRCAPCAQDGNTPLHAAALCGHAPVVATLLEHGARKNPTSNVRRATCAVSGCG